MHLARSHHTKIPIQKERSSSFHHCAIISTRNGKAREVTVSSQATADKRLRKKESKEFESAQVGMPVAKQAGEKEVSVLIGARCAPSAMAALGF